MGYEATVQNNNPEIDTTNNISFITTYKSSHIPDLVNSISLLSNLNNTFWRLKFYKHTGKGVIEKITASFISNNISISIYPYNKNTQNEKHYTYRLTLIQALNPNEAIFSYDYQGTLSFMYIRLVMPNLLAIHMAGSFEEIKKTPSLSLEKIGIFLLE
ncbi:hypothetical protein [Brevinema andersonii]|nr:hypothetical protein [Brevinema andersonii]